MAGIKTRKGVRFPGITGLLGDQPDAQPQLHVGLDHIGILRAQHDIRHQPLAVEGFIDSRTASDPLAVGD